MVPGLEKVACRLRLGLFVAAAVAALLAGAADGQTVQPPPAASADSSTSIVITAKRLSQARASIQPQVGASTYTISAQAIKALPEGENAPLNQVVLPGAVGATCRTSPPQPTPYPLQGEHNSPAVSAERRVILPEGLSVFSQGA